MRAIVIKELRENLKWLPVGVLLIGVLAWLVCPVDLQNAYGARTATVTNAVAIGAGLYAIFLGGLQSAFDFSDRQRGFLHHRNVSLSRIIYGKVIAGAVLYVVACAVPLLCLTVWFYWKGPEFIPVRPAQLVPALLACVGCFALHPATMLTFIREARWFGTRLLPLLATAAAATLFVSGIAGRQGNQILIAALLSLPVLLLSYWAVRKSGWARAALLIVGAACVAGLAMFISQAVESSLKDSTVQAGRYSLYGLDETGDVWAYRAESSLSANGYEVQQVPVSGEKLQVVRPPNVAKELPTGFEAYDLSYLQNLSRSPSPFAFIEYANGIGLSVFYYDSRGFLLLYKRDPATSLYRFSGTISKQGFHPPGEDPGERFTSNASNRGFAVANSLGMAGNSFWLDTQGVYQFDWQSGALKTLLELPIDAAAVVLSIPDRAPQLMLESGGQIYHYAILNDTGSSDWFDAELVNNRNDPLAAAVPQLQLRAIATLPALPTSMSLYKSIASVAGGKYVAMSQTPRLTVARIEVGEEAQWQIENVQSAPFPPTAPEWTLALLPAGLFAVAISAVMVTNTSQGLPPMLGLATATGSVPSLGNQILLSLAVMLVTLLMVVLTFYVARARGLGRKSTWLWALFAVFGGLTAPLALCALYPKLVCEPCPRCDRARRIDRDKCQYCSSPWEPPPSEGIEILEQAPQLATIRNADLVR